MVHPFYEDVITFFIKKKFHLFKKFFFQKNYTIVYSKLTFALSQFPLM